MDSEGEIEFQIHQQSSESNQYNQHLNNNLYPTLRNYFEQPKKYLIQTNHFQEQNYYFGLNQPFNANFQKSESNDGLFKTKERVKNFIQIQFKNRQKVLKNRKGTKQQTSLLNINFKTYLTSVLKQYLTFQQVNSEQEKIIKNFVASKANFSSFRLLYGMKHLDQQQQRNKKITLQVQTDYIKRNVKDKNQSVYIGNQYDKLRKFILKKLSNQKLVKKIIGGDKMNIDSKLVIIRFLKQIRRSCIHPQKFNAWKSKEKY